jgi:serine/threonine protein kinase/Flp pilus assembly protein TadD
MANDSANGSGREDRLHDVIASCVEAAEAGRLDRDAVLARHPEFAAELAEFFAGRERLDRVAAPLRAVAQVARFPRVEGEPQGGAAATAGGMEGSQLGDFRLVREVGRGGMGIVYEAEQVSLRRRVALKVLPFAATMDPRQLARFRNETYAAASLHHTNIVPVYYVGCERGIHYYAMQFIDGQPLSALLHGLRRGPSTGRPTPPAGDEPTGPYQPGAPAPDGPAAATQPVAALTTQGPEGGTTYFRAVARLGEQAAEALQHAHDLGVLHRDVKPGNLLLDGRGNVWVTDFGLARVQSEASLTETGDLVGTLRYMSPEQSLAGQVTVDHRTDVYSLGATLYELLTLQPVFGGKDRQELLQQITFEEPVTPRRLCRAVPAELETIVLKALEKAPQDRYATAQALAEDLRRFLDDRPIQARRASLAARVRRWLRRHRLLARAAALVVALGVAMLAVTTVVIWREKEATAKALTEKVAALGEAEASEQAARRDRNRALDAVDQMLTRVGQTRLQHEPRMEQVRRALLEDALQFYQEFLRESPDDPRTRLEIGVAYRRVGYLRLALGQHRQGAEALHQAIALLRELVDTPPGNAAAQKELGVAYQCLGRALVTLGRGAEAEQAYKESLGLLQDLVQKFPNTALYQEELSSTLNDLGRLYRSNRRFEVAEKAHRQSLDVLEQLVKRTPNDPEMHSRIGARYNNLAVIRLEQNDPGPACKLLEEAIAHQRLAVQADRRNSEYRTFLRNQLENLTLARAHLGQLRVEDGRSAFREILALGEELAKEFPAMPDYQAELAGSYHHWANLTKHFDAAEAKQAYNRSQEIYGRLVSAFPTVPQYQRELAGSCWDAGRWLWNKEEAQEAEKTLERSAEAYEKLISQFPDAGDRETLTAVYLALGKVLQISRRPAEARAKLERALALGRAAAGKGATQEAERTLERSAEVYEMLIGQFPDAEYQEDLAAVYLALGQLLQTGRRRAEAGAKWERALALGRDAAAPARCTGLFVQAMAHWHLGHKDEARRCHDKAAAWMDRQKTSDARLCRFRAEAAQLLGVQEPSAAK